MRRLLVLVLCVHVAVAIDTDGDGYEDHDEVLMGGHPLYAHSTPETDDDGNGQTNREGVETGENHGQVLFPARWITHSSFYEGGTWGIGNTRHGHDEPPCGNGRSFERVRICDGTVYVYDGVCAPALLGDYEACRDSDDRVVTDGYGWTPLFSIGAVRDAF